MLIEGLIASFLMGTLFGLVGAGGAILTVPILVYVFEQDVLSATTNSLFVVGAAALVGALMKSIHRNVAVKAGFFFALPSFFSILLVRRFLLPFLPDILFSGFGILATKQFLIMAVFAFTMFFSAWAMIRSGNHSMSKDPQERPNPPSSHFVFVIGKGLLIGAITGFVGAGGGFLIIPALVFMLKFPIRLAVGTSLAIVAANSLFGFVISFSSVKTEDCPLLLIVSVLAVAGMLFGDALSSRMNERLLKKGFGYFVLTAAVLILYDQGARL
ncbi:sulfite exporter TauE/SafE family protein [Leptospira gomenensis]|uniref:Probable membrane transporter protein n=1 Tax=Leptospira gomenensis TaxID=2484974 RepID=A0A5F1YGI9_9LEPT|nr:sulfite exporter TauE/SafE family protein [Leptospira gomenensis]TGK32391.1 sulfite exporter TauE/SafE family protein [Leptospira gomenensis]TGK43965.1 sulfite exporter TauE/SafE family protein [Leptospira gomenensis]TGK48958.1 sulfite exporter TauE/SafE family protein [Leptospira gomenensis]TGK54669.1 sulfite exporter TauE/SafE family protein [Leptospira gomenensis]